MIRQADRLTCLRNARVVTPEGVRNDCAVLVREGRILDLLDPTEVPDADEVNLLGRTLMPGFIDTQVNGGGGVLFNDAPTLATVNAIAGAHARFGTTGLLPTLISDHLDVVRQGLLAVDSAIEAGVPGVLGIHIEGPFLDRARRGVHDAERLQSLTDELVESLEPLRLGATLITLAPEQCTPAQVRRLVEKGFVVSAGHSGADYETVAAAIDAGLTGFTHLFNAMSPLESRHPGMVGAALDREEAICGIIADGHHVADASLRVAWRCKGPDGLMLVTDAMPPVGTDQTRFELLGAPIEVIDGVCRDQQGTLAGTALDMARALRTFLQVTGCSLADAARLTSTTPARFLGLGRTHGAIAPGYAADFAMLDDDLQPVATVIGGHTVWAAGTEESA